MLSLGSSRRRQAGSERGAVVVLVAIWLPVLALFASFAIDVSHWFDYSRNLQVRADDAALAAGMQYGNTCGTATPNAAAMAKVGEAAQLYSGPGSTSDLPYAFAAPTTDFAPTGYQNVPTLKAGTLNHYHVFINAPTHWTTGQTSPAPSGQSFRNGTVCHASYADDNGGAFGPITDIWLTQDNLPLFFPLLKLNTTISAHARVELRQGVGDNNIRPIAVRDSTAGSLPSCASVNFVTDDANHTVIKTVTLTKEASSDPKFPQSILWDNPAGDNVSIPSANVIVQAVLGCGTDATTYNDSTNSGLLYINSYGTSTPSAGQAPRVTTGGVFLTGTCTSDQYFSSQDCSPSVTANVAFAPGTPYLSESVTAVDTSNNTTLTLSKLSTTVNNSPPGTKTYSAGQTLKVVSTAGFAASGSIDVNGVSYPYSSLPNNGNGFVLTTGGTFADNAVVTQTGDTQWTSGVAGVFSIPAQDGQHPIRIDWQQTSGSVASTACTPGAPCKDTFGIQAQAFGACSACDAPDSSGPIVAMRLHLGPSSPNPPGDPAGSSGRNAFAVGANPKLVVEVVLQGLTFDVPNPNTPAEILRVGTSTDQATGLIDCGQGNGAGADKNTVTFGCPLVNTAACKSFEFCAPLKIYDPSLHPNGKCDPLLRDTSNPAYTDCVSTISGTRRVDIPEGIADRIIQNGVCSTNHWPAYASNPIANPIPGNDPRAVVFIITAPADLSKNSIVPIKNFATFYVTGWDTTGSIPSCSPNTNEAFPGKGKAKQGGAIWGHWIEYTDPNAIAGTNFCDPTQFGICATVLTR